MDIRRHAAVLAALLACCLTATARAAGPDYDYLAVGAVHTVVPGGIYKPSWGYFVAADWEVPGNVLLGADYTRQRFNSDDFFIADATVKDFTLDVGYKFTLAEHVDLAAKLVHTTEQETIDEHGFQIFEGTRHYNGLSFELRDQVLDHLEVHGGYTHWRDDKVSNTVSIGVLCPITPLFAMGTDIINEVAYANETSVTLYARFQF